MKKLAIASLFAFFAFGAVACDDSTDNSGKGTNTGETCDSAGDYMKSCETVNGVGESVTLECVKDGGKLVWFERTTKCTNGCDDAGNCAK